ncbi:MAG: hypothetical protein ACUVQ5_01290 [Candidatus Methanomethylicaceae archaeon]
MKLVYSAVIAIVLGIVLVSSPLLFTGVSPTDLKARGGVSESYPLGTITGETGNFSQFDSNISALKPDNASFQLQFEYTVVSQYSLYGVFSAFILGIVAATFSYFVVKKGMSGKA